MSDESQDSPIVKEALAMLCEECRKEFRDDVRIAERLGLIEGARDCIIATIKMITEEPAMFLRSLPTDARNRLIEECRNA